METLYSLGNMRLWEVALGAALIAIFLALATFAHISYERLNIDRLRGRTDWPVLVAILAVPVATLIAMLITNW